jgi:hypothetical protein
VDTVEQRRRSFLLGIGSLGVSPLLAPVVNAASTAAATLEEIGSTTWSAFAQDIHIAARFVRERVKALAEAIQSTAPRVIDSLATAGLNREAMTGHASLITSRAVRLTKIV